MPPSHAPFSYPLPDRCFGVMSLPQQEEDVTSLTNTTLMPQRLWWWAQWLIYLSPCAPPLRTPPPFTHNSGAELPSDQVRLLDNISSKRNEKDCWNNYTEAWQVKVTDDDLQRFRSTADCDDGKKGYGYSG